MGDDNKELNPKSGHLKKPSEELNPWSPETKKVEVGWLVEGIKALSYAWADCEEHLLGVEHLLQKSVAQEEEQQRKEESRPQQGTTTQDQS